MNGALYIKIFLLKIILAALVVRDEDDHDDGRCDRADSEEAQEDGNTLSGFIDLDGVEGEEDVEDGIECAKGSQQVTAVLELE